MGELLGELLRPVASTLAPAAGSGGAGARLPHAIDDDSRAWAAGSSLKILHILRAPVGGLFRHVLDVARGQVERGHRVGLIVDATTGGPRADAVLAELAPRLALGLARVAIARQLNPRDISALQRIAPWIRERSPDVLHGHGAKGAAMARLVPRSNSAIRVCTPHGGSLVYAPGTLAGGFYRGLERLLNWRTDLFLFESNYAAAQFRARIGTPRALLRVVRNGVGEADFAPIAPKAGVTDLVSLGELRPVKGFDVLLAALATLKQTGRIVSATIAGDGPDMASLRALAHELGIADQVRFAGFQPARDAFAMGRILVMPSRAESLPYVVLEAAAAGMPIIATRVGGIAEIFGANASRLIPAEDTAALATAIGTALADPTQVQRAATAIHARVRDEFSLSAMVDGGIAAYREALALRKLAQFT